MKKSLSVLMFLCLAAGVAFSADYAATSTAPDAKDAAKMDMAPKPGSVEFERIKSWAGKWEGASTGHGGTEKATLEYRVTSGGSAVEEKLFAGTSHEMVSMYYDNKNGKVGMTHFCMLGNRPHLELKSADAGKIDLDWIPGGGVDPNEMHMHSLSIATPDPTHITQTWTAFKDGKPLDQTVITLTKVS